MSENSADAQAGVAAGIGFTGSVIGRARHYLSAQHLFAAEHFSRLAADYERAHVGDPQRIYLQHRAYVMGAVLEAVAFLESFVNETLKDAADGHTGATGGLADEVVARLAASWQTIEGASVVDKYRMVRVLADAPAADAGRRPHDDVVHLVRLRNWLVHNKPRDVGEDSPDKVIDHVRDRFPANPFLDSPQRVAWFPNHALSAGCAAWGVTSAHTFADEFVTAIGSTREHHRQSFNEQP